MIRINLLPQKREARRASEGNQNWLLVVLGVLLLEVVVLIFVQEAKQDELKRVVSLKQKIDAQIHDIMLPAVWMVPNEMLASGGASWQMAGSCDDEPTCMHSTMPVSSAARMSGSQ